MAQGKTNRWAQVAACLFCTLSLLCASVVPAQAADLPAFADDERVVVIDDQTGQVICSQGADERAYPASTTKLVTTLVALDYVSDRLDERVTVGDELDLTPEISSLAHLEKGDSYAWRELFYGLLLPSGNDAAIVMGANVARIETGNASLSGEDALAEFARLMNEKVAALGCTGSHFVNPHGLHDDAHYTTANDMLRITQEALKSDFVREVVSTPYYGCTSGNGVQMDWYNSNWMLQQTCGQVDDYGNVWDEGEGDVANPYYRAQCAGVKTGTTAEAGRCLVFLAAGDGMSLLGVVLHAADGPTLYTQTDQILDSVLTQFERHVWGDGKTDVATVGLANPDLPDRLAQTTSLAVRTDDTYLTTVDTTQDIKTEVVWDENYTAAVADGERRLTATVVEGTQVATLDCYVAGELVGSYPLVATSSHTPWGTMDYVALVTIGLVLLLVVVLAIAGIARAVSNRRRKRRQTDYRQSAHRR